MKFVLASHNRKKLAEMQEILRELGVEVVLQSDVGLDLEPEENGVTFAENAAIKAMAVMQASGLPAIADDSGLCVDALNGAPGIYSARYGGVDSDQARYRLLLENLRGAGTRTAHFHTAIVCCFPNGESCWTQPGIATAPLPMHPRGTTASAMTRCFRAGAAQDLCPADAGGEKRHQPPRQRPCGLRGGAENLLERTEGASMELTSKQRAQLRGMAANLDTIVHVGKDGIGENLIKQVNDALEARELVKGRVLENSMYTAREAAEELKVAARCEVVQVIGSKFVLFRYQHNKDKRKIELEKRQEAQRMKIGIYGGTFNPIHRGHLTAARAALDALGLDRLLLIPASVPPHRPAPGQRRARRPPGNGGLACAQLGPCAQALDTELHRTGPSYTVDTLRQLPWSIRRMSCGFSWGRICFCPWSAGIMRRTFCLCPSGL